MESTGNDIERLTGVVLETDLPGVKLLGRGKVRDIYDLGEHLLIVTTDRISAFDCILPTGIPDKGAVLTSMSRFWFDFTRGIVANHVENSVPASVLSPIEGFWPRLSRRSMIVLKARPYAVECVVRGYLAGSAWKEYRDNVRFGVLVGGRVPCSGVFLPTGLQESSRLPNPIFTPSTKATTGHDETITFDEMAGLVGNPVADALRDYTLSIYEQASAYAARRGIILADTKLEFGQTENGIILIDEALTPDSSRFWDAGAYEPGRPQPSYDKQFVRDYLETLDWDKTPPAPRLPPDIVQSTADRYREAHRRIVGREVEAEA